MGHFNPLALALALASALWNWFMVYASLVADLLGKEKGRFAADRNEIAATGYVSVVDSSGALLCAFCKRSTDLILKLR
jgi:hypothetical protein